VLPDHPTHRPLERFWPYAELAEAPSDDELAALHPELREALFGAPVRPFSISLEFPRFDGDTFATALDLAKASDEFQELASATATRYRARFYPGNDPIRLRNLYELVGGIPDSQVLIDDRPLPFARELWLPLVWCLIQ
jgi:hypothetical protein